VKALQLRKIKKPYFRIEDIARTLGISLESAKVVASRYVKAGILIRLKRNLYILQENWYGISSEQKFTFANLIQTPSYISLMTALDYYEISTQMQQDFLESIAIKRTKSVEISGTFFNYTKIARKLYFGFVRKRGFFIAEPEKAFLDAVYLMSIGRYKLDLSSINFEKFNPEKIIKMAQNFPLITQQLLESYEHL